MRPDFQGTSLLAPIATADVKEVRVLNPQGEVMRDGPTNRVEMIVVAKSVVRLLNMVAATFLEIIAKSACLHGAHLETAKKR
jgi:hypothetical protein